MAPANRPRKSKVELQQQRQRLLRLLKKPNDLIAASLVELYSTCGKSPCRCHQGFKHGPAYYLSYREDGRTQMLYVPKDLLEEVREGVKKWKTVGELGKLNLELLRLRKAERASKRNRKH